MIRSKHLISSIAASAIVAAVGMAYAQTTETTPPANSTQGGQVESNTTMTPSTPSNSMTSPSGRSDSMNSTATDPAPQADRN